MLPYNRFGWQAIPNRATEIQWFFSNLEALCHGATVQSVRLIAWLKTGSRTEFENQFQSKQISEVIKPKSNGKILLNLKKAIEFQLRDWGLPTNQIDCMEACTFSAANRFYSARRDGAATGRMINGLMLLP